MSEADWWLCEVCQSLNNLSARRCYSCRRRKPKRAQRASQHLGYRVIESWDGKVRLEQAEPPRPEPHVQEAATRPPPLREPVSRSIVDVAPPPPQGARITYWLGDPARDPRRRLLAFPPSAAPMVAIHIEPGTPLPMPARVAGPHLAPGIPVAPGAPGPGPMGGARVEPGAPPPGWRPMVAVPIAPSVPSFPHWRELLEVPTPDPARLRQALGSASNRSSRSIRTVSTNGGDRREPAMTEPSSDSEPFVAWPAADLASRRSDP
jgi:hypothetical protein